MTLGTICSQICHNCRSNCPGMCSQTAAGRGGESQPRTLCKARREGGSETKTSDRVDPGMVLRSKPNAISRCELPRHNCSFRSYFRIRPSKVVNAAVPRLASKTRAASQHKEICPPGTASRQSTCSLKTVHWSISLLAHLCLGH